MATQVRSVDYVFPVFGGDKVDHKTHGTSVGARQILGTAFPVGAGFFVTANHVIQAAKEHQVYGIGRLEGKDWKLYEPTDTEGFSGHDIGLICCGHPASLALPWTCLDLPMLEDVQSVGYPYGLDLEESVVRVRSFKGYVSGAMTWGLLEGRPGVYELSYMCPRGLSGAPLWLPQDMPVIAGVMFGNNISEMVVYSEKETDHDKGTKTVYEKVEAMHMGLAVKSIEICPLRSKLLRKTIGDHLQEQGLMR